jgi:hypothetical protein
MPTCTAVERKWLDAMLAQLPNGEGRLLDPKAAAELETDILLETTATGKELFEKLVRAIAAARAAQITVNALYDRAMAAGFRGGEGRHSPFVVFCSRATEEAARRFPDVKKEPGEE